MAAKRDTRSKISLHRDIFDRIRKSRRSSAPPSTSKIKRKRDRKSKGNARLRPTLETVISSENDAVTDIRLSDSPSADVESKCESLTLEQLQLLPAAAMQYIQTDLGIFDRLKQPLSKPRFDNKERPSSLRTAKDLVYQHGLVYKYSINDSCLKTQCLHAVVGYGSHDPVKELAQALFFHQGLLLPDKLPLLGGQEFKEDQLWQCGYDGEHTRRCHTFAGDMVQLQGEFLGQLVSATLDWISIILLGTTLDINMMERESRIKSWEQCLKPTDVETIFSFLRPALDFDVLLTSPAFLSWTTNIVCHVADDIIFYHYASPLYHDWLFYVKLRFREWVVRQRPGFDLADIPLAGGLVLGDMLA